MRAKTLRARVCVVAWLVLASVASHAGAGAPPLAIGEVKATTPAGEFGPALKQALREELSQASLPPRRAQLVLSATLVKLTAEKKDGSVRATAVVSLALRRARDSTLHAMLSGKATAEEAADSVEQTRDSALRAAVRSALRGLPQAVAAE